LSEGGFEKLTEIVDKGVIGSIQRSGAMSMNKFIKEIGTFLAEEEGLTIVEYAIGGALVAAGAVLAFSNLGTSVCDAIDGLDHAAKGETDDGKCPT